MSNILLPQNIISSNAASLDKFNWEKGAFYNYLKYTNLFVNTFEEIKPIFIKCYDQDCLERVIFECKCSDEKIYICKTHAIIHLTEHGSKIHNLKTIDTQIDDQKRDELHDYLKNYNSDLEKLKIKIVTKVTEHFNKINRDMILLFENIDARISKNKLMASDLISINQKIFESKETIENFLKSSPPKKYEKICISDECLDIFAIDINDWNASRTDMEISKPPNKDKLIRKLFNVTSREKSLELVTNLEKWIEKLKMPFLHWFEYGSDEVYIYDHFEKPDDACRSIRINGLDMSKDRTSISIDFDNILLCCQEKINDKMISIAYKINLSTKSYRKLAQMKTFRSDFCMAFLDGSYYALGGMDDRSNPIELCEKISSGNNWTGNCWWEGIYALNEPRQGGTCVSIPANKSIYIFGGKNDRRNLNWIIEKYDAISKKWAIIKFVMISGLYLGSCLLPDSNLILIYGGRDENDIKKNIGDCYFYNYEANQFSCADSMQNYFKCYQPYNSLPIIFDNKIYCERNKGVYWYDIESGVWLDS